MSYKTVKVSLVFCFAGHRIKFTSHPNLQKKNLKQVSDVTSEENSNLGHVDKLNDLQNQEISVMSKSEEVKTAGQTQDSGDSRVTDSQSQMVEENSDFNA